MNKFHFINSSLLNKVLEFLNFLTSLMLVSHRPVSYKDMYFDFGDRIRMRFLCLQSILDDFVLQNFRKMKKSEKLPI